MGRNLRENGQVYVALYDLMLVLQFSAICYSFTSVFTAIESIVIADVVYRCRLFVDNDCMVR